MTLCHSDRAQSRETFTNQLSGLKILEIMVSQQGKPFVRSVDIAQHVKAMGIQALLAHKT